MAVLVGAYLVHVKSGKDRPLAAPPAVQSETPAPAAVTPELPSAAESPAEPGETPASAAAVSAPASQPKPAPASRQVFFRYTGTDQHYGQVAWSSTTDPAEVRYIESLNCEVVYVAGGRGICLSADRGVFTTYATSLFDTRTLAVTGSFPLKGIPSRARVSIDGSLAALTVFVSGHGYTTLDFSTQTLQVDTKTGTALADLEEFEVRRDGKVTKSADFNFWGVTFTPDARHFYATLSTDGKHYLVRGDVGARRADIIHENVECPSLSPDARHVAYKKRLVIDNRIVWQLQVLDLANMRETALAERRSIDDQLEWLDDRHVLYSVPSAADDSTPSTDVWIAPIDAATAPRPFIRNAYSPAAARCKDPAACQAAG